MTCSLYQVPYFNLTCAQKHALPHHVFQGARRPKCHYWSLKKQKNKGGVFSLYSSKVWHIFGGNQDSTAAKHEGKPSCFHWFCICLTRIIFCRCNVALMLLVLCLMLNGFLYFCRLMLFNEAIKLFELFIFKVNSLLVIYIASLI